MILLGFAVKATHIVVEDKSVPIFKLPKGDASKASAKGLLFVDSEMKLMDNVSMETESSDENLLQSIFIDGKFVKETSLEEIRELTLVVICLYMSVVSYSISIIHINSRRNIK